MTAQVCFKCDSSLRDRLQEEAAARGINLSEYLRIIVEAHLGMQETIDSSEIIKAVATIRAILDRRMRAVAREDPKDISKLYRYLGSLTFYTLEHSECTRNVVLPDDAIEVFEMIRKSKKYNE